MLEDICYNSQKIFPSLSSLLWSVCAQKIVKVELSEGRLSGLLLKEGRAKAAGHKLECK